jgi:ATP-dependent protease ClpP protease subunit
MMDAYDHYEIEILIEKKNFITEIEKQRNSKVLVYVSNITMGYPQVPKIYNRLKEIGHVERLDLFLVSFGGDIDAAFKIVSLCRQHCNHFSVIVPFLAKSAATLLSLGADEIVMGPISELGPIDPQIAHPESGIWGPAQALRDFLKFVETRVSTSKDPTLTANLLMPIIEKLDPWVLGNFERSNMVAYQYAEKLLGKYMLKTENQEKTKEITKKLTEGYYSHGYGIDVHESIDMGLKVTEPNPELWDCIWDLYGIYHQEVTIDEKPNCLIQILDDIHNEIYLYGLDPYKTNSMSDVFSYEFDDEHDAIREDEFDDEHDVIQEDEFGDEHDVIQEDKFDDEHDVIQKDAYDGEEDV